MDSKQEVLNYISKNKVNDRQRKIRDSVLSRNLRLAKKELSVIASEVLKNLPVPFGTYPKAKYILRSTITEINPVYSFVTTTKSPDEALEILKQKMETPCTLVGKCFYAVKIVDSKPEIIWHNIPKKGICMNAMNKFLENYGK